MEEIKREGTFSNRTVISSYICGAILAVMVLFPPQAFTQTIITTVAGNGTRGFSGDGGQARDAALNFQGGITVDSKGNLYIADSGNHRIRQVGPDGTITTIAGNGNGGFSGDGGAATRAALNLPSGLALDTEDNLFVLDRGNQRIRKISHDGIITTIAGNGRAGFKGDGGPATDAMFDFGASAGNCAIDKAGNLYIPDTNNNRIRKIDPGGIISTLIESPSPFSVAANEAGDVYFGNGLGVVTRVKAQGGAEVVAGGGTGWAPDAYPALTALLIEPIGVAVDATGNLYITDSRLQSLRKLSPYGTMTPLAGSAINEAVSGGFSGDGGPPEKSTLNSPSSVAVGRDYTIYVADGGNNRIRRIAVSSLSPDSWTPVSSRLPADFITALVVDPFDPYTLFAGTASHGVFKSTNAGTNWLQSGPANAEVSVLVGDPDHAGTFYVGTYNMGIIKSTDGGATWSGAGSISSHVNSLTLDPHNPSDLLLSYYSIPDHSLLLFESLDAGESWRRISLPSTWIQSVAFSPVNLDIVYLFDSGGDPQADTSECHLWKSSDRGQHWTMKNTTPECLWHLVPDPTEPNTLFAYGENPYKSTDGAESWTTFSLPIDVIAADPIDAATLYSMARGNVYRSTDKGNSWSSLIKGLADAPVTLAVSGSNPAMVFAGTYAGGVFRDNIMFTVNRTNYCIGEGWQANITGAVADAPIQLVGVSNGVSWEWPHWGTTSSDGSFTATGVFLDGSQGTHSLHVEIGQVRSNTVSLAIQSCTGYMPQLEIKLTNLPPDHQFCFGAAGVLTVSNGPPNASVTLHNAPPGFNIAAGATTDSQGSFSVGFRIPFIGIDVYDFTFWAEVGGIRSNSLSITTFDCD